LVAGAGVDLQGVRDVLVLRLKCGMHMSEINRVSSGQGVIKPVKGHRPIAGTIRFVHKSGRSHTVSLDAQALAAVIPRDIILAPKPCEPANLRALVVQLLRGEPPELGQGLGPKLRTG